MDRDQLIEAVIQALNVEAEPELGLTSAELAQRTGWNVARARRALRHLIQTGRAEVVWVRRPRMDGVVHTVPAYRLVEPEERDRG